MNWMNEYGENGAASKRYAAQFSFTFSTQFIYCRMWNKKKMFNPTQWNKRCDGMYSTNTLGNPNCYLFAREMMRFGAYSENAYIFIACICFAELKRISTASGCFGKILKKKD